MSRTTMYVHFPDGTTRYGMYDNDADQPWPNLFDDVDELWGRYIDGRLPDWDSEPAGEVVPVELSVHRRVWFGTAATNVLVDNGYRWSGNWGDDPQPHNVGHRTPEWAKE